MGARLELGTRLAIRSRWGPAEVDDFLLDVRRDARGEFFYLAQKIGSRMEFLVLDVQPKERHLLLLTRRGNEKHRFLAGHDERHWFLAGIPEATPVSRVQDALQALKPGEVIQSEHGLRAKQCGRRVNRVRIRQEEWFFVRANAIAFSSLLILRNEPIVRSRGGKPHMCEELFRTGGETVYVSSGYRNGLSDDEYARLDDRERKRWNWTVMRRNPEVYARGSVRHPDHKTVYLDGWHRVFSNTENLSHAMRNIVFLD